MTRKDSEAVAHAIQVALFAEPPAGVMFGTSEEEVAIMNLPALQAFASHFETYAKADNPLFDAERFEKEAFGEYAGRSYEQCTSCGDMTHERERDEDGDDVPFCPACKESNESVSV